MKNINPRALLFAVFAALTLSSCGFTPQGDLFRGVIRDKGAQAYDQGLENNLWASCVAASVGSIRRKFGHSIELMDAYNTLCRESAKSFNLVIKE